MATASPVCAIVGVGPGLGLALARRFGLEGFHIALLARSADRLSQYERELARDGVTSQGIVTDAGAPASLVDGFARVRASMGSPEVLIYNAADYRPGGLDTLTAETLQESFAINVGGALVAAQQVLPAMQAQDRGTLIFTGGAAAFNPSVNYTALSIGKASLRLLALSMAQQYEGTGIHVATVTIYGGIGAGSAGAPERIAEAYWQLHRQQRGNREAELQYGDSQ